MTLLLALETAGSACSVAVLRGRTVLASECRAMRYGHGEALLPMVDSVMRAAGLTPRRLDRVAVSIGPGGFTGVRVGLAAAQGIARGAGARLVGVTSFAAVAARLGETDSDAGKAGALLVALDSRRDDLYVQLFPAGGIVPIVAPRALLPEALAAYVEAAAGSGGAGRPLLIAGDAAAVAAAALGGHPACEAARDLVPEARGVAAAALRQLEAGDETPALPLYLRPPDVTAPRPIAR